MRVTITEVKVDKIWALCRSFLAKRSFTIRRVASLIGTLVSTFPGVELGPLHYRRLERDKDIALRDSPGDFEGLISLCPESIGDLNWWVESLPSAYRSIDHGVPNFTLTSHASLRGWGAASGISCTHSLWSEAGITYHINVLELLEVELGLRSLLPDCQGQHIRVVSDNTTTVSYINGMGGKSLPCDSITGNIWSWAIDRGNWLSAAHIPGASNVSAEDLSRNFKAGTEWALSNDVFVRLCSLFGVPDIDLFASRLNHKVPKYASWKPGPIASFVDAFTLNWSEFSN